ncbi:Heterokaryon incompatibility [Akanthomyces lecanii RCEF 1005]|uniref:Heterokaryon incompatibility n=1 Tax=Akanthomyces lecanii RCEF 1005 TaxID=1081108 RepID=A0A168HY06_CORDF|nr:Heterokaryon incompatibility [Akanthomyces lecanii RCEF 1005]
MPDRPCGACHHPRPRDGGQASVITSRRALEISSASCVICRLLARGTAAFRGSHGGGSGGGEAAAVGTVTEPDDGWLRIDFNRATVRPSLEIHIFSSGTALSLFSPSNLPLARCLIPASTASAESYAWARNKLLRCQSLHKSCRKVRDDLLHGGGSSRPRRLLDIGREPVAGDAIHLHEADCDYDDAQMPYAALSHCWGRSAFLQTRLANVAQHRSPGGIALASLPRTFREAVDATRRLGLRYLWIDSLCIVQDDPRDWEAESARMAAVYQGAYLVLCASRAAGAHDGLYSDAAGSSLYTPHMETVEIPAQQSSEIGAVAKVAFRRAYAHVPSPMQRQLQAAPAFPTLSRGWIYQERLLTSRVLHYGPHELHWECMAESICQCRDADGTAPLTVSTKPHFSREHWQSLVHDDPHQLSVSWHRLVEAYTALHLSFDKDVFPALSGIAKTFQSVARTAYLAGLWQSSLILDLAWHAHTSSASPSTFLEHDDMPPTIYRAPSWSWAAVRRPVKFVETHRGVDPFCRVVEAEVQRAGSDQTGELTAGHLILAGYALSTPASFRPPPEGLPEKYSAWNLLQLAVLQTHVANVWADYDCHLHADLPPTVLCFLLGECVPSGALLMLILKPTSTDDEAENYVYGRIGIVQVSKPPSSKSSLEYWRQVFQPEQLVVKIT